MEQVELQVELMGIVNRQVGVVDLFNESDDYSSVALPAELSDCGDPERINDWAMRKGLIQHGQCIAVPES